MTEKGIDLEYPGPKAKRPVDAQRTRLSDKEQGRKKEAKRSDFEQAGADELSQWQQKKPLQR